MNLRLAESLPNKAKKILLLISFQSSRFSIRELRPKTAPSEYRSWLKENDNNYLSKRNSFASDRSGKSQITNVGTTETTTTDSNSQPDGLSMVEETTENAEVAERAEVAENGEVATMNENHTGNK